MSQRKTRVQEIVLPTSMTFCDKQLPYITRGDRSITYRYVYSREKYTYTDTVYRIGVLRTCSPVDRCTYAESIHMYGGACASNL